MNSVMVDLVIRRHKIHGSMQNNFVVAQDYPNNMVNSLFFEVVYALAEILLAVANVLKV